jgi:hypothetical protein
MFQSTDSKNHPFLEEAFTMLLDCIPDRREIFVSLAEDLEFIEELARMAGLLQPCFLFNLILIVLYRCNESWPLFDVMTPSWSFHSFVIHRVQCHLSS